MKTLVITLEYPPKIGGIATYIYNFALNWPGDISIYAPQQKGDKDFDLNNPWPVYRRDPYFTLIWPRWLKMYFQIRKIVKKNGIKLIHVHHVLPSGYVAFLMKKIFGIPYYLFLHGTDLQMATKNGGKKRRFKKICGQADKIIINSNFLKEKLLSQINIDTRRLAVLNPCPGEIFLQPVPPQDLFSLKSTLGIAGKKVILTVARLAEGKGFPHLLQILPKILNRVPNLVWLVVGDGPKREELVAEIQKNNLQNIVRIIGEVQYNKLPAFYQCADLFVMLTHPDKNAEEAWGMAFLEASASGLAIVAGRVGGVEEAVINSQTGLVVDVSQDINTESAIVELLQNTGLSRTMGENGRQRVLNEFSWKKQLDKIIPESMRI